MGSQERIRKALDQLLYLPHLQAQHTEPSLPVAAAAPGGSGGGADPAGRGRPWDRGDLFRRLATFKSGTWFGKPPSISPVECARRGWTNTGPDMLTCEFCKAKVSCPLAVDLAPEQVAASGERYAERLSSAHDAACPWRTATSAPSLLQFPPLTEDAVRRDFQARCGALQRLLCLPPMAEEALGTLAAAASPDRLASLLAHGPPSKAAAEQPREPAGSGAAGTAAGDATPGGDVSEGVAVLGSRAFEARARVLALCGWDLKVMTAAAPASGTSPGGPANGSNGAGVSGLPAHVGPESAALQCSLCAAKAGLWTFFPQCKPKVLPAPRRAASGSAGARSSAAPAPTAALAKSAVSRNVAADIGTTIAGGAMLGGGAVAAPFGASAAQPAFGAPSHNGAATPVSGAQQAEPQEQQQEQQPAASSPFGGCGAQSSSMPVFGFAALQASRPADQGAGGSGGRELNPAGGASIKRKQPDFSWSAVMADIDAKAASEKRSRSGAAGGGAASGGAALPAAGAAAGEGTGRAGADAAAQQQAVAAAAAARKYASAQASQMDPLALHRPFCPWVNRTQAGEKEGRCGWRWCLQQLLASPVAADGAAAAVAADDNGGEGEGSGRGSGRGWDPAKLLRQVLQQVDVRK